MAGHLVKFLLLILIAVQMLFIAPSTAYAQNVKNNWVFDLSTIGQSNDNAALGGSAFEPTMFRGLFSTMAGWACALSGLLFCTNDPTQVMNFQRSSAIGLSGNIIASLYTPPASSVGWAMDTGRSMGLLPKPVYAQGIGFAGLNPILGIWKAFRNIAYVIMAIVMFVIGFMVMFRKKIDPKTVVTVQNSLPRVVITLLLITFSYAIAGLMIDLMYLVFYLMINVLVQNSSGILGPGTLNNYATGGFPSAATALFSTGWASINDIIRFLNPGAALMEQWLADVIPGFGAQIGGAILYLFGPSILGGPVIGLLVLWLLITIALIFAIIRIFFMLLSAYINVIIAIIFSPLQLLLEAFPGGDGFMSWIKNLLSNLAVFPITAVMLLIGTILTNAGDKIAGGAGNLWVPPLLGNGTVESTVWSGIFGIFGQPGPTGLSASHGIGGLIGLGILSTIPSVVNGLKEALKAKPPVNAGIGAVIGPMGGGLSQLMQFAYQYRIIFGGHGKSDVGEAKDAAAGKPKTK